ncbi:unnamed protein product [Oppiella nova]|uniref:Fibronectin type-III domain-containing protein n=1 Tax=Oppiella nova TaxID=334625 RepID=A0A7R9MUW7_9ACAR|nr:unnamed protein product [Oppiella nova]CAG2184064.1 unnamed protein product [Oppiella nova]
MTSVLKGLLPDFTYYFKIQARNNKGYGPISAELCPPILKDPSTTLAIYQRTHYTS